ncbi:hypothetical protein GS421_08480 [Rhodococcus hoagii]|nr:hypothetical protein [Prescottella equi]
MRIFTGLLSRRSVSATITTPRIWVPSGVPPAACCSNSEWARCTLCIVVRHTITTSGESASAKSPM